MSEISALTERVQALEDRLEITQLLMMHPMSIDSGAAEFWMSHWTEDSTMDRYQDPERHSGDYAGTYGKATMLEEIKSPELAQLREDGLMHISTSPSILIDGDTASATNYTQLIGLEGTAYRIRRVIVNRWELRREDGVWRISKRTMRPMGHTESIAVMKGGLDKKSAT